ncbi:glycosyltransferase family 1 protein [Rothia nasimurium]|uniref:Glycosyltransferase family 1 protein n=1 Tax=Rothia nasimurium TaxID=85336 RepID=A0A4Y9F778_9MICC|nr:glycosyltransferase family 4 protein [Rothia nasimurium]MBF0807548.1 glycosyltransferase family 4 protein [Rothia nasimurium]TFU23649.1 glycosyltransferase family 1 protein [Rothia nasimurium]
MRIVIMVHRFYPDFGGVEVTAELIARGFVERHNAEVIVVTHTKEEATDKTFPFKVLREPSPIQLWKAISGADVVFHNNPCMQFYWPQLFMKKPWVVALRTWITLPGQELSRIEKIKYWLKYKMVERADLLVGNSKVLAGHVNAEAEVIYNSYRDDIFKVTNTEERDPESIVYLGRLSDDKGIDLLLEAVSKLVDRGLAPKLSIIGGGDYQPEVERIIGELNLQDRVVLYGPKTGTDIADILNQNAISVVPSRIPEPFGTVTLEEAASGCVVLVANHGGLPEAIGDAGPKFTPNNADSLADQLEKLIADRDYYESFQEKIPSHVENYKEHVFIDKFYDAMVRAYQKVNG